MENVQMDKFMNAIKRNSKKIITVAISATAAVSLLGIYLINSGRANADEVEKLQNEISVINRVQTARKKGDACLVYADLLTDEQRQYFNKVSNGSSFIYCYLYGAAWDIDVLNTYRAKEGRKPVVFDPALYASAYSAANRQKGNSISHNGWDAGSPYTGTIHELIDSSINRNYAIEDWYSEKSENGIHYRQMMDPNARAAGGSTGIGSHYVMHIAADYTDYNKALPSIEEWKAKGAQLDKFSHMTDDKLKAQLEADQKRLAELNAKVDEENQKAVQNLQRIVSSVPTYKYISHADLDKELAKAQSMLSVKTPTKDLNDEAAKLTNMINKLNKEEAKKKAEAETAAKKKAEEEAAKKKAEADLRDAKEKLRQRTREAKDVELNNGGNADPASAITDLDNGIKKANDLYNNSKDIKAVKEATANFDTLIQNYLDAVHKWQQEHTQAPVPSRPAPARPAPSHPAPARPAPARPAPSRPNQPQPQVDPNAKAKADLDSRTWATYNEIKQYDIPENDSHSNLIHQQFGIVLYAEGYGDRFHQLNNECKRLYGQSLAQHYSYISHLNINYHSNLPFWN